MTRADVVIAIDPGPTESAWLMWDQGIVEFAKTANDDLVKFLNGHGGAMAQRLVIEKIACYGMAVGAEVFETCVWTGRFMEAFGADRTDRIERLKVKLHLCHDSKAKDANIRAALIDRLGPPGTKKNPGPTYGIAGDIWSALAVAITWSDSPEYWMARKPVTARREG